MKKLLWFVPLLAIAAVMYMTLKTPTIKSDDVATLVNLERAKAGLPALRGDYSLYKSAEAKCADMVNRGYYSHQDPEGRYSWYLFEQYGASTKHMSENLSRGANSASTVVNGWMKSKLHHDAIVSPHNVHVGYGVCTDRNVVMVVQHFTN